MTAQLLHLPETFCKMLQTVSPSEETNSVRWPTLSARNRIGHLGSTQWPLLSLPSHYSCVQAASILPEFPVRPSHTSCGGEGPALSSGCLGSSSSSEIFRLVGKSIKLPKSQGLQLKMEVTKVLSVQSSREVWRDNRCEGHGGTLDKSTSANNMSYYFVYAFLVSCIHYVKYCKKPNNYLKKFKMSCQTSLLACWFSNCTSNFQIKQKLFSECTYKNILMNKR